VLMYGSRQSGGYLYGKYNAVAYNTAIHALAYEPRKLWSISAALGEELSCGQRAAIQFCCLQCLCIHVALRAAPEFPALVSHSQM